MSDTNELRLDQAVTILNGTYTGQKGRVWGFQKDGLLIWVRTIEGSLIAFPPDQLEPVSSCPWTDATERAVAGGNAEPPSCPVHPRPHPEGLSSAGRAIVAAMDRRPNPANWSPGARIEAGTAAVVEGVLREGFGDAQALSDLQALDLIAYMLRDPDWGVGMLEDIAELVTRTGRSLENPTDEATWFRH